MDINSKLQKEYELTRTMLQETPPRYLQERLQAVRKELTLAGDVIGAAPSLVIHMDGEGKVAKLQKTNTIGSGEDASISVRCQYVSSAHCRLTQTEGCWLLEDGESRNGTFVNGEKVSSVLLKEGDLIQIGTASLCFFGANED